MTVLGNRIRRLRKEANLTQVQLGKLLDCSSSTISLYEGGQRSPDTHMLIRLADVFDVSVDYLLGRVTTPTPTSKPEEYRLDQGASWTVTEELTPEGAEFLEAMTREVKKHFAKKERQQAYSDDSPSETESPTEPSG